MSREKTLSSSGAPTRDTSIAQRAYIDELVQLNVDVIVAVGSGDIQAVKKATATIPIVMMVGGDPVGSGFISSLARPGGNITGLSHPASRA